MQFKTTTDKVRFEEYLLYLFAKEQKNLLLYGNSRGERPIGEMIMSTGGLMQTATETCAAPIRQRSLTERLKDQLARHEEKVSDLKDVIEKLERQPETQELIDAISKLGHF